MPSYNALIQITNSLEAFFFCFPVPEKQAVKRKSISPYKSLMMRRAKVMEEEESNHMEESSHMPDKSEKLLPVPRRKPSVFIT